MKKIFLILFPALFVGCADDFDIYESIPQDAVELTTVRATIETSLSTQSRANEPAPVYLSDHISRFRFEDRELMTFTSIKRTAHALNQFNYVDVSFKCNSSGAWDREKATGHLINGTTAPERVYWSDALSKHTFIAYSKPNVAGFDWEKTDDIYYGSIGDGTKDITEEPLIDYNPATPEEDEIRTKKDDGSDDIKKIKKSSKMRAEDLLLSYDTTLVADASVANVKFYHALSSIKVQVSMSGFYGSELDGYAIVKDMKLLDQPTLYMWNQNGVKALPKSNTHSENKPKDIKLWDYYPNGTGSGASKSFTFYGITVPQESTYEAKDLRLTFTLRYPDPVKTDLNALKENKTQPTHWLEKPFSATIPAATKRVYFHPGQCTVINLRLNHMNEELTVGAEYMDWQFVSTPDEGELYKNTTFLSSTARTNAKIASDNVTEDDATWLYYESDVNGQQTTNLLDIYKHNGKSVNSPYTISTANQLLAFAYEVKNGRTFDGLYVKLDADIFMQESTEEFILDWIGIGDADHVFNGTFIGGGRKISRLKDSPLFYSLGEHAIVDNLIIADTVSVTGSGSLANTNAGTVIGCLVDADMVSSQSSAGSLLGSNSGTVEACYHIGSMTGTSATAGLVGQNSGTITGCYNAGPIIGSGTCYGVTNILSGGTSQNCYYNKTLAGSGLTDCVEMTTLEMQKEAFVSALNAGFNVSSKYAYTYNPAMYPTLIPYSETIPPLISTGYYRVKNIGSQKYVYVTDNKGSISSSEEDLGAIELKSEFGYSDPGSIIYIENVSGNEYNLHSQGTSVRAITGYNVIINIFDGHYRVGATSGFANRYLGDINGNASTHSSEAASTNYLLWDVIPVDETNYFGVTPTVNVSSSYYAPFYADFGFKVSTDMEVYYAELSDGSVTLKKIDSEIIPAQTPVIIKCKSVNPADNKLTLQHGAAYGISGNALYGVMFNNETSNNHNNQVSYNSSTMRVLRESGGNLVFTTSTETYLPANQSYLVVPAETEQTLSVNFE